MSVRVTNKLDLVKFNLKFEIEKRGEVTYKIHEINVNKDVDNIENVLRLTQAKFWVQLALIGPTGLQGEQ